MAINPYFTQGTTPEKRLYESLIIEAIQIYGIDVYYIPRKIIATDAILTEDTFSKFDDSYKIEMYLEEMDGFGGDGDLMSKFGFEIRDEATFKVANLRWNQLVGQHGYDENEVAPKAGDLIYMPMNKNVFEIKHVENELPFYQLQDLPTFTLKCELFQYESQDIDTGITGLDELQTNNSSMNSFLIDEATRVGTLIEGETLTFAIPGGDTGSTEFFEIQHDAIDDSNDLITSPLTFNSGKQGTIIHGTVFTGMESGASVEILSQHQLNSGDKLFQEDLTAQNTVFGSDETRGYLDFSESNPFGDPFTF